MRTYEFRCRLQNKLGDTLASIFHAKSGHPGGCLSCIDILVVLLKWDFYSDPCKNSSFSHSALPIRNWTPTGLVKRMI